MTKSRKRCMGCLREINKATKRCPHCGFSPDDISSTRHLRPETLLHNRYVIGRVLGEGGFGITYLGYDQSRNIPVAIKEFFPKHLAVRDCSSDNHNTVQPFDAESTDQYQQGIQRMAREWKTLQSIQSLPHIISSYDFFQANQTAYLVMEYVPGISLQEKVIQDGTFTPQQIYKLLFPIMKDLNTIHQSGLLHRDITPDNIMVRPDGVAKLIDFGSARIFHAMEQDSSHTMTIMIKHHYAPKEQYLSKGNQGPWTDVYALSATIYFALTGTHPVSSIDRENQDTLPPVSTCMPYISTQVSNVIAQGMSLQIKDRYSSVAALSQALKKALSNRGSQFTLEQSLTQDIPLNTQSTESIDLSQLSPSPVPLWKKRKKKIGIAVALVFLFLIGILLTQRLYPFSAVTQDKAKTSTSHTQTSEVPTSSAQPTPTAVDTEIVMPSVINKRTKKACTLIHHADSDLIITIEKKYSKKIAKGNVISQSISPGSIYRQGATSTITLYISRGAKPVVVASTAPEATYTQEPASSQENKKSTPESSPAPKKKSSHIQVIPY